MRALQVSGRGYLVSRALGPLSIRADLGTAPSHRPVSHLIPDLSLASVLPHPNRRRV